MAKNIAHSLSTSRRYFLRPGRESFMDVLDGAGRIQPWASYACCLPIPFMES